MSEIKKKTVKEVENVVGYKCDICGREYKSVYKGDKKFSELSFTVMSGGFGERLETKIKHLCSAECVLQALDTVPFDCELKLQNEQIKGLVKYIGR